MYFPRWKFCAISLSFTRSSSRRSRLRSCPGSREQLSLCYVPGSPVAEGHAGADARASAGVDSAHHGVLIEAYRIQSRHDLPIRGAHLCLGVRFQSEDRTDITWLHFYRTEGSRLEWRKTRVWNVTRIAEKSVVCVAT